MNSGTRYVGRLGPRRDDTMTKKGNGNIRITRGVTLVPLPDGQWRCRVNVPRMGAAGREAQKQPHKGATTPARVPRKTKAGRDRHPPPRHMLLASPDARVEEFAQQ